MISIGQVSIPAEEIEYCNKDIKLRINDSEYKPGELLITKSEIAWKDSNSEGFSIPYEKIVVHAISAEQQRSIYFMIDCAWPHSSEVTNNGNNHEAENDSEEFVDCGDEESEITEFWMVPEDLDEIDNIYYAMSRHPQQENMDESDDDDDNFFDGEDIDQMNINDERFADD